MSLAPPPLVTDTSLPTANQPVSVPYSIRIELRKLRGPLLALGVPVLLLLISYLAADPFKILRTYRQFYPPDNDYVFINREYVSTELYTQQQKKQNYNSFIFGNSRSLAFLTSDWKPYLNAGAKPFHFDASSESLFGITHKVRFLDSLRAPVRQVFAVIDYNTLEQLTDRPEALYCKDPRLGGASWATFHQLFARAYIDPKFFIGYWKRRITGKPDSTYADVLQLQHITLLPVTNDYIKSDYELELAHNEVAYYRTHAAVFTPRTPQTDSAIIGVGQRQLLAKIKRIFKNKKIDYQFIISPNYNQHSLNPRDVAWLKQCFGADRIHDFSGVNPYTADFHNYYEASHYRPHIARDILKRVYGNR